MTRSQSGSDDSNDSRKRPSEDEVGASCSSNKRQNCGDNVHFKILVPSIAAGAVIGKGGEGIAQIQKETGAKVKMSKANEFYPATVERVCLIVGTMDAILAVHNYIMDKIMERPDPNPRTTSDGRLNVERHKQVKILVPNSTAGMVIGKGGAYIQEIKDRSGAYVQISQKAKDFNLPERCIIVAGDPDQNRVATRMILEVIAHDPQSAGCPNLSYTDILGPVASVYPTGSPYAVQPSMSTHPLMGAGAGGNAGPILAAAAANTAAMFHAAAAAGIPVGSSFLTSAGAASPPGGAFYAPGGMLSLLPSTMAGLPSPPSGGIYPLTSPIPGAGNTSLLSGSSSPGSVGGGGGGHHLLSSMNSGHVCKKEIEVPESLVGVILGPQGRAIVELQSQTGTLVQISKKGVYASGTQNRLVTISGGQLNVQWASTLIAQRIQLEEVRRQGGPNSGVGRSRELDHGRPENSRTS